MNNLSQKKIIKKFFLFFYMIKVKELIKHYESMKNCDNKTKESEKTTKDSQNNPNQILINHQVKVKELINYFETLAKEETNQNIPKRPVLKKEYTFKYCPISFDTKVTFVKVRNHLLFLLKGKESDTCLKPSELSYFFKYYPPNELMDVSTVRFIINRNE
ncbi:hypothetical protein TUBRATIS_000920 [Tubulinosema ratisbonensis]|uniref:Uncharacterized protein n=1 Tax=Tubulinosema ratisbonensis TaxID=291195 RepID=A0A437AQH5_9MICR|nr:hypothetical protein TUBRATIS_000920 [Tubulinosema ratisbonensis]